jgi:hypothetical protein
MPDSALLASDMAAYILALTATKKKLESNEMWLNITQQGQKTIKYT